jgi:peroxiredoxin Q/BCP
MPNLEGKTAPDFTLSNQDGKPVSLSNFAGRQAVLLYFYPKDDTPGCTKEACGFRDTMRAFAKLGVAVLGMSPDGADSHQKFVAKYKLPFPLLSDPDRKVMKKYGAFGAKMMYGKKTQGVIRSSVLIGKDGKVLRHWARIAKAEAHPEQALAVAQELLG